MPASQAFTKFLDQKNDINQLWSIHTRLAGAGRGRKPESVEVINRATIVFVAACWESYIEDLLDEAFEFLLKNASTPDQVPDALRGFLWSSLHEAHGDPKNPKVAWGLAGDGWKETLNTYAKNFKSDEIGKFHSPKTDNIDSIFKELLGMPVISDSWYWQKMSTVAAKTKLDQFMETRGKIAHRAKLGAPALKKTGSDFLNHIDQLVAKTDAATKSFLEKKLGRPPW